MLRDRRAIDPKRIRLGSPGDESKRLVERSGRSSFAGNAESHRVDASPCPRVTQACLHDRASKSAATVAWADIDAPDARAVLLLLPRFPNDARHRHESFRRVRIGDREDGTVGIRKVCLHRGKLSEGAVFRRCPKRRRLRQEGFASECVEAGGVLVRQPPCVVHVGQYPGRLVRAQLWRTGTVLPMRGALHGESSFTRDHGRRETRRDKRPSIARAQTRRFSAAKMKDAPVPGPRRASFT